MDTVSRINQEQLAVDTIFYLHKFLKTYNTNTVYNPLISVMEKQPYTSSTCRVAISFFPNGTFDGGSCKINVIKQKDAHTPHLQSTRHAQSDQKNSIYELLIISEAAMHALKLHATQLEKSEKLTLKSKATDALIKSKQEECGCYPFSQECSLF